LASTGEEGQESGEDTTKPKSLSNEEISERIESATDRVKSRTVRRNRTIPAEEIVSLGTEQRKAVGFVEFAWGCEDAVAPCLDGPVATGKTVLSCSLLWKRRFEGPQLLACSPAGLVSTLLNGA